MTVIKRVSVFFLSILMLGSTALAAYSAKDNQFSDVYESDAFFESCMYCVEHGMVSGSSETTFSPNDILSRAQFVTILARMDGVDLSSAAERGRFKDVKASDYFAKYVYWTTLSGVTSGISETAFDPHAGITKEQAATCLYRYLIRNNLSIEASGKPQKFADSSEISTYAIESVEAMQRYGIFDADDNGNFNPKQYMTRGEAVVVFHRLREALIASGVSFPISKAIPVSTKTNTDDIEFEFSDEYLDAFCIEFEKLYCDYRVNNGQTPAYLDSEISYYAQIRANEMLSISNMSHIRPDGSKYYTVFGDALASNELPRENIQRWYATKGYSAVDSAQHAFSNWVSSSSHNKAMLTKSTSNVRFGLGFAYDAETDSSYIAFEIITTDY